MSKRVKKVLDLEEKIRVQENALVSCFDVNMARVHDYLLQKLTDEWCALQEQLTEDELLEMAEIMGVT